MVARHDVYRSGSCWWCHRVVAESCQLRGNWRSSHCGRNRRRFGVNVYGRRAMEHWRRWLPARYATIQDPEAFFSALGVQAESQVLDLAEQLEGPDLSGEGYLEKVGRLNMARMQAEELVLREVILLSLIHI